MKKWMIRAVVGGAALVIVVVIAVGWMFWSAGKKGSGAVEQWIGGQIQTIAGSYLNPKLSFSDLDYEYPATVKLKQLRLTADDPANAGKTIDIVGTDDATLTLGEIPQVGKPIKIEKIILNKPLFQAVAIAPGGSDFVGFANLLKPGVIMTQPTDPPQQQTKLSEAFQIRLIELKDGRIVYEPRLADTPAMELNQINTSLAISPTSGGVYHLETKIIRDPVFALSIEGNLDLDRFNVEGAVVELKAMLGAEQATFLPPQLQKLLKDHGVRGAFSVRLTGDTPVMEPMKGTLSTNVVLTDAHFQSGEYSLPLKKFELSAKLRDGRVALEKFLVQADRAAEAKSAAGPTTAPALDLAAAGNLDLARMTVEDIVVDLKAAVGRERDGYLPPDVRKLLAAYAVRGDLAARVTGAVPILDPMRGVLSAEVRLDDAHVAAAGCEVPVQSLVLNAKMQDQIIALRNFHLIGGGIASTADKTPVFDLSVAGEIDLAKRVASNLLVQMKTLLGPEHLGHLPPQVAAIVREYDVRGLVSARVMGAAPLDDPLKGSLLAEVTLADARVHAGGFAVPIKAMDLSAKLEDGRVVLEKLHAVSEQPAGGATTPAFDLDASGKLTLADLTADDVVVNVKAMVGREHDALLPADIQQMMKQHDVRGLLAVKLSGAGPVKDPLRGAFAADVRLDDANYVDGAFHLPIKLLELSAKAAESNVALTKLRVIGSNPKQPAGPAPFDLSLTGNFNVNTFAIEKMVMQASASFGPGHDNYFPPAIQELLKKHQIRGGIGALVTGAVPIRTPMNAALTARVAVADAFVAAEGAGVPIKRLDMAAEMAGGRVKLSQFHAVGHSTAAGTPAFDLSLVSNLSLADFSVDGAVIDLKTLLGREQDSYLPPDIAKLMKQYDVDGAVTAHITGAAPLRDVTKGTLAAAITVDDAHIVSGDYRVPAKKLDLNAKLQNGQLLLEGLTVQADRGSILVRGNVTLNDQLDADLATEVTDIFLEDVLQRVDGAEDVIGRVNGSIVVTAPLSVVMAKAAPPTATTAPATQAAAVNPWAQYPLPEQWGWGQFKLDGGRLVKLPVVDSLVKKLGGIDRDKKPSDTANLVFDLAHDDLRFSTIEYTTTVVAAHGKGTISLDQKLDLYLNGGPLEKMQTVLVQPIAEGFQKVTDSISTYRITGTMNEPLVSVDVAGTPVAEVKEKVGTGLKTGAKATGTALEKTGEAVGGFFKKIGRKDK
jgi:hypothetical protein